MIILIINEKINIAIIIVSDTRTDETDKSGKKLKELIDTDGHTVIDKIIIKDNIYQIRLCQISVYR